MNGASGRRGGKGQGQARDRARERGKARGTGEGKGRREGRQGNGAGEAGARGAPAGGPSGGPSGADRARALAIRPVSRETAQRLDRYVDLLVAWQRRTNLIAASTVPTLWTRHVADSLQLVDLIAAAQAPHTVLDLGSGAGFPGIVIACALADVPGTTVHLVESNLKKAAFLREAIRETGAPGIVHDVRIEALPRAVRDAGIDYVTARALAPLPELLEMSAPYVKRGAKALFPKGQDLDRELTESGKKWSIEAQTVPSRTSDGGRILVVRALTRRTGPGSGPGFHPP